MLAQGAGSIVAIASFHSFAIIPHTFPYPVAKHGLLGLVRALGIEYAAKGVRVNAIAPGYIETDLNRAAFAGPLREYLAKRIPGRKHGNAEDVARLVAAIYGEDIPFLTGETIYIDGGQGIAH